MIEEHSWNNRGRITRRGLIRSAAVAAGMLSLAPVLAACGTGNRGGGTTASQRSGPGSRPVKGGTLTVRVADKIDVLDYAYNHDVYSGFVVGNCVESLITHDAHALPQGLLAESWQNPDDVTYIFRLRQGVQFQDGTDFNADAVAYSMNRIRGDKASTQYANLLPIDKIEQPDAATVRITLRSPFAPFLEKLTTDAGRVVSPRAAEKLGKERLRADLTDVGTGPFNFLEWKQDDHLTLIRNEHYWGRDRSGTPLPYLDKVIVREMPDTMIALAALANGEIDAFRMNGTEGPPPKDTAAVRTNPAFKYQSIPGLGFQSIVFNEARAPFASKELRQAVSYAIDRAVIAKNVFFDTAIPLDVVFAPAIWTHDREYHPYLTRDLGRAKQLMAQAGRPNGFSFDYFANSASAVDQQMAELIKDQLKEAGIDMTIKPIEFVKLTQAMTAGQHQAGSLGWSASYDPDDWVYSYFSTRGSNAARTRYSNPEVDRLLDQARTTLDSDQRRPLYQQAQKLIMDDAPLCFLYDKDYASLSSSFVQNCPMGSTSAVGVSQVWKTR